MGEDVVSEKDLESIRKQIKEIDFRPNIDKELAQLALGHTPEPIAINETDQSSKDQPAIILSETAINVNKDD